MGELERYGLLALASLTVLFLVLTFVRRDPVPRELASIRLEADPPAESQQWPGKVTFARTSADAPRVVPIIRPAEPVRRSARPTSHVVKRGETLGQLAKRYLGASRRWPELVAENAPLDPRALQVGQVLRIPGVGDWDTQDLGSEPEEPVAREEAPDKQVPIEASQSRRPTASEHVVKKGETLSSISNRYYGDCMQWKRIYLANRDRIPDARRVEVGTILRLP
ncbi:MAG: LysM peptidoglycan-binding domain-containing protein [Planctomycetota bacterium]